MQPSGFRERQILFQEKSDHSHFLAISVHKRSDVVRFPRSLVIERCLTVRNLLIDTIKEIENVTVKTMESVYLDDLCSF